MASETEELVRGKPKLYWRLNAAMTVAFVVGAIGLATMSVGLIWEAGNVARFGGSIAAVCAVVFFASLFFAMVINETYSNQNDSGETDEAQV